MQPVLLSLSWPEACKRVRQSSQLFSAFLPETGELESVISLFWCLLDTLNVMLSCLPRGLFPCCLSTQRTPHGTGVSPPVHGSSSPVFASQSLCWLCVAVLTGPWHFAAVCTARCCNFIIVLVSKRTVNELLLEPGLCMLPEQTGCGSVCWSTPVSSNTGVCSLWSPGASSASLPRMRQVSPGCGAFAAAPAPGRHRPRYQRGAAWPVPQRKEGRVTDTETREKSPDQWTRCLRHMMLICCSGWRRKGHPLSLL